MHRSSASSLILLWAFSLSALGNTINVNLNCSLHDAIRAANADAPRGGCPAGSGVDTIVMADDWEVTLSTSLPTITSPMTIRTSTQSGLATIDGDNSVRPLRINGANNVQLENLRIRNGQVNGLFDQGGGGVLILDSNVTMERVTVINNTVFQGTPAGGGIKLENSHLTADYLNVQWNEVTLRGNSPQAFGGQIALYDSTADFNHTFLEGYPTGAFTLSTVAMEGGGLYLNNSEVTMTNSGIFRMHIGEWEYIDLRIPDGFSQTRGADIFLTNNSSLSATNSTFEDPQIVDAHVIPRVYAIDSDLDLNHVTLSAASRGIYLIDDSTLSATNSLFLGTISDPFFCRKFVSDVELPFTLIADVANLFPQNIDCGSVGGTISPGNVEWSANNGGFTPTKRLKPLWNTATSSSDNPAVNSGNMAFCTTLDQRGLDRGSACDIGAYELRDTVDLAMALELITNPPYYSGQTIRYHLNVSNNGPADAYGVDTSVDLEGLSVLGYDTIHDCSALDCRIASIPSGGQVSIALDTFKNGTSTFDATALVNNITDFAFDPVPTNNTDDGFHGGTTQPAADLSIDISMETASPHFVGQQVDYQIEVTNHGPNFATDVQITHGLVGLTGVSYAGCNTATQNTCDLGSIASGNNRTVTFTAEVTANDFTNTAFVNASQADQHPDNNSAEIRNTTAADADIQLDVDLITSGPYFPTAQIVQYRITVKNQGPDPATNVTIESIWDNLFITNGDSTCQILPCVIPVLGVTEQIETVLTGFFANAGIATHEVHISSDQNDPDPDTNQVSVHTSVEHAVDISIIVVDVPDGPFFAGQDFEIDIQVINLGTAPSNGVTFDLDLLNNLDLIDISSTNCSSVPCDIPGMEVGSNNAENITLRFRPQSEGLFSVQGTATGVDFDGIVNNTFSRSGTASVPLTDIIFFSTFGHEP